MKIIITGGSGLLGQYLNLKLSINNDILTLYNSNPGNCLDFHSFKSDITDSKKLAKLVSEFRPDLIIHTAAISRPESCDELPEVKVKAVNIESVKHLSELCELYKSKLIYTSTDLVYDGNQGMMIKESDKTNPVSLYAETKLQAEEAITNVFDNYIILRTSLLFGIGLNHSVNNFHSMIKNFKNNLTVKLFFDQFRTPLSIIDAADLISILVSIDIKNTVINFGGKERVSRSDLGEVLCRVGKFDRSLIEKISMYEIPKLHKVADVSMNTNKLQSLGLMQKSIEESILQILLNKSVS